MTRWMHPPELKRPRQQGQFDPLLEGDRYGVSRELALAIWRRVCADAADSAGLLDEKQARQRFHELAVRIAARGGRLRPDPGRVTRVGVEISGDSPGTWIADELRPRVPGRETLVAVETRRWAVQDERPAVNEVTVADEASIMALDEADGPTDRNSPPDAGVVARAMAALQALPRSTPALVSPSTREATWGIALPIWPRDIAKPFVPGRRTLVEHAANPRLGFDDYRVLGLKGLLRRLGSSHALRAEVVAAAASADRSIAGRATLWGERLPGIPTPAPTPSGQALWCAAERHAAMLYRRAESNGLADTGDPAVESALQQRGAGQPLALELRRAMERELGVELVGVRIHTDAVAAHAARALGAEAFTVGEDVFFAAGMFAPETHSGRTLLAHELTHVAQALRGQATPVGAGRRVSQPGEPLEQEAETVAARIAAAAARGTWAAPGRVGAQLGDEARAASRTSSTPTAKLSTTSVPTPPATRTRPGEQVFRRAQDGGIPGYVARANLTAKLAGSHGTPLPMDLRTSLAQRLGNLDDVRVHTDELADRAARALSADAFTVGKDVYFAAGMYEPSSASGQQLIAHEVMHTVQTTNENGGEHLRVSSPGEAHEQQADAFADAFVAAPTPREAAIISPEHRDAPRLVTPVTFAGVSRHPSGSPPSMGSLTVLRVPDVDLFDATSEEKKFTHVDSVVPLAKGVILLGEIPVTYNADAGLKLSSMLRGVFGPGKLAGLQVELSDAEMMGHDMMDDDPIASVPIVPILGPRVGVGPSPRDLYDKVILRKAHTAEGWASAKAHASAEVFASATISGGVAALDVFGGGVTGGLHARAQATADANASIYASVSYAGGVVTMTSLKLGSDLEFAWNLSLGASAGVYVELKMPNIPVISGLSHTLQKVPVVNWFVPDLTELKWRKDFTKSWDLTVSQGVKSWKKDWELAVSGSSPSAAHPLSMSDEGFDLGQLVKEQLAARNPDKAIPGKDDGPDKELKDGAAAGAVASTRQAAKAQAKSARDDIRREQTWNKKELTKAVAAIEKTAAHVKAGSVGGPAPLAIGGGSGTPEDQHKAALEARDKKLAEIDQGVQNVDKKIDEVRDAAEDNPDGPSRNYARKGYEALGKTADSIGQDVAGYGAHADEYKRPVAPNAPQNANTAEAEKARLEARRALDENSEKVDTELIRVDKLWQDSNGVPEIATYMAQIDAYRADIRILCERPLKRANKDWEDVPTTFPEPHEQTHSYREIIIPEANAAGAKLEVERGKLPKVPWDEKWVILENRKLMLIPSHRTSRAIRNTMYPDYTVGTKAWMKSKLETRTGPKTGQVEWRYSEAEPISPSTGAAHWWLLDGPDNEKPTIAHDHPSVGKHWNTTGRLITQKERGVFMNGMNDAGPPGTDPRDKNLGIEPKSVNSTKANQMGIPLRPDVGVGFRGPAGR